MNKYTYWNYGKTGGWELACNFFYNNRSMAVHNHSHPVYAIVHKPIYKIYLKKWFYQSGGKLHTHTAYRDFSTYDKIKSACFPPQGHEWCFESPFKTDRGDYNLTYWGKTNIDTDVSSFYECSSEVLESDLINVPHILLGYNGNHFGDAKLMQQFDDKQPQHPPHNVNEIIEVLRSKVNIVPYKENYESMVKNILAGSLGDRHWKQGQDFYVEECVRRIKSHKKCFHSICSMLEYNCIPYKVFNLDKDKYEDYFDLDRWLPIQDVAKDHDKTVLDSMPEYRHKFLPNLIDRVLCLM